MGRRRPPSKGWGAWLNWYVNRGRMAFTPTDKALRMISWRRP